MLVHCHARRYCKGVEPNARLFALHDREMLVGVDHFFPASYYGIIVRPVLLTTKGNRRDGASARRTFSKRPRLPRHSMRPHVLAFKFSALLNVLCTRRRFNSRSGTFSVPVSEPLLGTATIQSQSFPPYPDPLSAMRSSSVRSSLGPRRGVNVYCSTCEFQVGIYENDWIRLTSTYAIAQSKGTYFATNVSDNRVTVQRGEAHKPAEGCVLSEAICANCSKVIGQLCRDAMDREKSHWM